MNGPRHIAVFGNPSASERTLELTKELIGKLSPFCAGVECMRDFHALLVNSADVSEAVVPVDKPGEEIEMIVCIGGDGTFLRAVSWEGKGRVPIAGLNAGHLGYLTGWTLDETDDFVEDLKSARFRVERRSLIKVESDVLPEDCWPYALNEVAILKESSANMISVSAEIDGEYLADYDADGLIVSTPTGSTGYNLSVGGPILEPQLRAWILGPVAAHSLNMRPLVVSDESRLKLTPSSRNDMVLLSLDGRSVSVPHDRPVYVSKAPFTTGVVRKSAATFASTLREKLYWGVGGNRREDSSFS